MRIAGAITTRGHVLEAASECWIQRILDVDHVQPSAARLTTAATSYRVGESGLFVDHDVVSAVDPVVIRVFRKGDWI